MAASARQSSRQAITSVADAILVTVPTREGGRYLLLELEHAVAISRMTGLYALLFKRLSRRHEGARGEIGVARIECSRTQWQKHCEECGDDGKRPLATFHGPASRHEGRPGLCAGCHLWLSMQFRPDHSDDEYRSIRG
jgi:hypothetical protein